MRIILLLLSLAVVFLSGVLYGLDRDRGSVMESPEESLSEPIEETVSIEPTGNIVEEVTIIQSGDTLAYKAASALSTVVEFFYEMVVEILYQISKLFY